MLARSFVLACIDREIHKNVKWKRGPRNPVNPHIANNDTDCHFLQVAFVAYTLKQPSTIHWAPNGSVPQNICSSGNFLLGGRRGRNNMSLKGKCSWEKTIQGVWFDLISGIAAMCYFSASSLPPPPHSPLKGVISLLGHTYFPTAPPPPHWRC